MAGQTWREIARPIIRQALATIKVRGAKKKQRALRPFYPFRERRGWPYRVWLDEVRVQLGLRAPRKCHRQYVDSPGQNYLF